MHTHTHPFPSFLPCFTPTSTKALARGILPYPGSSCRAAGPWLLQMPPCTHLEVGLSRRSPLIVQLIWELILPLAEL